MSGFILLDIPVGLLEPPGQPQDTSVGPPHRVSAERAILPNSYGGQSQMTRLRECCCEYAGSKPCEASTVPCSSS
jgi:hypothetical protein